MSEFFDTPIADVITLQNDKKAQLKTPEYQSSGVLPIIDQSSKFICGYTDDFSKKYSKSLPVIVFGDHTLHTKYIDFDFAVGADGTQVIKTQDPHHQHKYLYYVISREIMMMGSEGYKRHLKILRERVVPFTNSVPEQKKIASILTSVDKVIENTQKQIDKLQDLKKGTMNELLSKGIGHTEFKDSELGRIPKSWEVRKFGAIATSIKSGLSRRLSSKDIGIPVINSGNISSRGLNIDELKYWYLDDPQGANTENYLLQDGDILLNFINSTAQIGKSCVFESIGRDCIYTTNLFCIRVGSSTASLFLHYLITQERFQKEISLITKPAVNQASFTKDELAKITVPVPPLLEQDSILKSLGAIEKHITENYQKLHQTQSLKKSLMQDLLTGKVRVMVS